MLIFCRFGPKPHTHTHVHTGINMTFFIHKPSGGKKKKSTKRVLPLEQKEPNITEPVNVPGSILSPQTSRRTPDEMTQNLLRKQLEWRDAWRRHHFRENFISDKPNLMLRLVLQKLQTRWQLTLMRLDLSESTGTRQKIKTRTITGAYC